TARDAEGRRLPGTVRSEQGEDLAGQQSYVDPVQHVDRAVSRPHCGQLQDGSERRGIEHGIELHTAHDAVFAVPRYARCTDGFAWISCGVPHAITRPKSSTWMIAHVSMTSGMSCSTSSTPRP